MNEEKIEALIAQYRPPEEILEEDRVSGPFVEGNEMIVGVGDQVYRATITPPFGWMMKAAMTQAREERGEDVADQSFQVIQEAFEFFKPEGLMTAVNHPANAQYIIGAWANVTGAIAKERGRASGRVSVQMHEIEQEDEVNFDELGRELYEAERSQSGILGALMPRWNRLNDHTKAHYINRARQDWEDTNR